MVQKASEKHQYADSLSPMKTKGTDSTRICDELPILTMEGKKIQFGYSMCFECNNVETKVIFVSSSFVEAPVNRKELEKLIRKPHRRLKSSYGQR